MDGGRPMTAREYTESVAIRSNAVALRLLVDGTTRGVVFDSGGVTRRFAARAVVKTSPSP